jgi:hypothetical protein
MCRDVIALLDGALDVPGGKRLNDTLWRRLSPGQQEALKTRGYEQAELTADFYVYIRTRRGKEGLIRNDPERGVPKSFGEFIADPGGPFGRTLYGKLTERLRGLREEANLLASKTGGASADEIQAVIKEHFMFRYTPCQNLSEGTRCIRIDLYKPDSAYGDVVLRNQDLLDIAGVVTAALGPVSVAALTQAILILLPKDVWLGNNLDSIDEVVFREEEDGKTKHDYVEGAASDNPDFAAADALARELWETLEPRERFLLAGKLQKKKALDVIAWCARHDVAQAPKDEKRCSDLWKAIQEKLRMQRQQLMSTYDFDVAFMQALCGKIDAHTKKYPPGG